MFRYEILLLIAVYQYTYVENTTIMVGNSSLSYYIS